MSSRSTRVQGAICDCRLGIPDSHNRGANPFGPCELGGRFRMKLYLIAYTAIDCDEMAEATGDVWRPRYKYTDADSLAEFAGRGCYESWDRPNPATRENSAYLAHIIDQGHESVLEHASASFYVSGVSRTLSLQLAQHVFLSTSELSQRYVDMEDAEPVIPPALAADFDGLNALDNAFNASLNAYDYLYQRLRSKGHTRKRAREAARAVLPGMTETRMTVSGNYRAWRDFLRQRLSPYADAEIYAFAQEVRRKLMTVAPATLHGIDDPADEDE